MDKNSFIKRLLNSKLKDYSYTVAFFLIFSFFVYFVIRPNLLAIFKSLNKIEELNKMNSFYDLQVKKIIDLQTNLELIRDDYAYINGAMPVYPQINKVFSDLKETTEKDNLLIENLNFDNINLKDNKTAKSAKLLKINLGLIGGFENLRFFINDINSQLRLKSITDLSIIKEKGATESSQLKMELVVDSFYL